MYRPIICTAFGLLLAACATAPQPAPTPTPTPTAERPPASSPTEAPAAPAAPGAEADTKPPRPDAEPPRAELGAEAQSDLMFHILSAELAAKQGSPVQALESYLAASRLSDDPELAERATRIGVYLGKHDAAVEAAARWRELAPSVPEPYEALGLVALRAGDTATAADQFREAVRLHPAGPGEGFARVAALLAEEADKAAGFEVLRQLADGYPDEPNAHLAVAELALQAKQPAEAVAAAERAHQLDPDWTAPALLKVRAWLQLDQGGKAVRLLEDVLEGHPDDYDLRLQYARTLLTLEHADKALTQFEYLLKAQPQDGQVLYVAALIALEIGETGKARAYLLRLVNTGQRVNDAYYYLGRVAQAESDQKGALRWYGQVQGVLKPEALMRSAMVLARQNELAHARTRLREVRRDYPDSAMRSYLIEGELLREAAKLDAAYELYTKVLQTDPDNWDIRYARALTAAQLDRVDDAERDLRLLLAARPDSPQALNALGYTLVDRTDRFQEGYELIQQAHTLRPEDPAIVDSLGWAYFRLGRLAEARQHLEQAYALAPEAEVASHYVEVLWQLGERKQARQVLAEALKREPESTLLLEMKRRFK